MGKGESSREQESKIVSDSEKKSAEAGIPRFSDNPDLK